MVPPAIGPWCVPDRALPNIGAEYRERTDAGKVMEEPIVEECIMFEKMRIKEHMEVADAGGRHLGTVDEVEDDRIKLTRSDSGDGAHHYVPIDDIERIAENRIYLKQTSASAAF
jgi:hypothetical protein